VVITSGSVAPSAADSGTEYRIDGIGITFALPDAATCVPGETVFYVQDISEVVNIAANGAQLIECVVWNDPSFASDTPSAINLMQYAYGEIRCTSSTTWALIGTFGTP